MSARLTTFAFIAAASCVRPVLAQTDPYAAAHVAAANQLGVMEYCQGRGDVGADAVAAQRSAMARLPASSVNTDAPEGLGKQGSISAPNGATMTLDGIASSHNTTVSALCKQMGSAAVQSAATFQQNGMAPGGTMPQVPSLPNGMTMPTMPTMPAPPHQ